VADDRRVGQESLDVLLAEARYPLEVEAGEGLAETLTLAKDREPRQSGLEAFEAELLEEPAVVRDRIAPLSVVVGPVLGRRVAPEAADDAVVAAGEAVVAQAIFPSGGPRRGTGDEWMIDVVVRPYGVKRSRTSSSSSIERRWSRSR
jgi:hypothetical protein